MLAIEHREGPLSLVIDCGWLLREVLGRHAGGGAAQPLGKKWGPMIRQKLGRIDDTIEFIRLGAALTVCWIE